MTEQLELFYIQKGKSETVLKALESIKKSGEIFIQCLDKDTFQGAFYAPQLFISNYARIYNLEKDNLIDVKLYKGDTRHKFSNGYSKKSAYVHRFVANYFCNKKVIEVYGNDQSLYEVNHKCRFDDKKSNEENNRADNLEWVYIPTHEEITSVQFGHERENPTLFADEEYKLLLNNAPYNENSVSVEVLGAREDENGDKIIRAQESMSVTWHTPEPNDLGYYIKKGTDKILECKLLEVKYYQENLIKSFTNYDEYQHYIVELLQSKQVIEILHSEYRDKKQFDLIYGEPQKEKKSNGKQKQTRNIKKNV